MTTPHDPHQRFGPAVTASPRRHPTSRLIIVMVAIGLALAAGCGGNDGPVDESAAETDANADADAGVEVASVTTAPTEAPQSTSVPEPTATPDPTATPEPPIVDPLAGETIIWDSCGSLECGTVDVPTNYDDPSAGTLSIAVNVLRSTDPDARIGYLFVNPGGPGGSGLDLAEGLDVIGPPELRAAFDIVGFDPRGIGASEPAFSCGEGTTQFELLQQIDELADTPEEVAIGEQAVQLCVDNMGAAAMQLGTDEVVRDMDEIRKALGAEQISYLGFSYGSTIGGWYATLFPDRVASMVVDGARNPTLRANGPEEVVALLDVAFLPVHDLFGQAVSSCDETCPIWNDGDPTGYWTETVPKYDIVLDALGGDSSVVLGSLAGHLYTETDWSKLHEAIRALREDDDPSGFVAATERAGAFAGQATITDHVNCLDGWALHPDLTLEVRNLQAEENLAAIEEWGEAHAPLFADLDLPVPVDACQFYGLLDAPVLDRTFDGGGVDILVVGNVSDPATPFVQSEQYAQVLTGGHLVVTDHFEHVVYPDNPCVTDLVHAALINNDYPSDDVECPAIEFAGNPLEDVILTPTEFPNGATGLVPEGWVALAPGVWAADPTAEVILAYEMTGETADEAVANAEERLGGTAESMGQVELNGVTWDLYFIELEGGAAEARFAVGAGVFVAGIAPFDLIDPLTESVLQPALGALQLPEGG